MKWILKILLLIIVLVVVSNYAISNLVLDKINLKEKVFINKDIVDYLNNKYETSKVEMGICLYGKNNGTNYIINSVEVGNIINSTDREVYFGCSVYALGRLHSHIGFGTCYFSKADIYSFGTTDYKIDGLMCGRDKFLFQFDNPNMINKMQYGYGVVMQD